MAGYFLKRFSIRLNKQVTAFSDTALNKLSDYHWPGNIRELENVIERAVNISDSDVIIAEQIFFDQDYTPTERTTLPQQSSTLHEIVSKVEREVLAKAVTQYSTLRQIGDSLGLSHTAVLKKLRKYGLSLTKKA
ncbi:Anaerobic nitric oxide reductase transcription regulator NorR [bioreactor metagenome]|uniref:Anaerobic nitric oxide reductase transcription regulator NorR n=1 Tax=bioreactor metagenome TaxID=1076179 RepID=A0A645CHF1_9ZZZZ